MSQTPAIDSFQASSWHGSLQLGFARQGQVTQLIHNRAQAPLKVQRPFYPEGSRVCHAVILHTAGGMVGGDRLGLDLQLNPHAQALLTTAAAGKVYRSQGLVAKQSIQIQVAAGACLEWLPQETIVFNGALYQQDLRVELAPGATWLGWEITRLGRTARGEHFLQGSWRSRTEIWQQGSPLWIDSQWLQGGTEMLTSPHGLAGQPVVATLAWIGPTSPDLVTEARRRWTAVERQGEAGVTCLSQGLLCRYRGFATGEARHWFISVWQLLRLCYLQRSACPPRVWQI